MVYKGKIDQTKLIIGVVNSENRKTEKCILRVKDMFKIYLKVLILQKRTKKFFIIEDKMDEFILCSSLRNTNNSKQKIYARK